MGHKKYGVKPIEWWKHMTWAKKVMNRKVRRLSKKIKNELYVT